MGLVQEVVAPGQELDRAIELARQVAANAPLAVQAIIEAGRLYLQEGEAVAVQRIEEIQREIVFTEDAQEGVRAFSERRDPRFTGR